MLSPEYLQRVPDAMVELYAQAEADILADMARRINGYDMFIPSAQHQLKMLEEMGAVREDVLGQLARLTSKSTKELERVMQEAGMESVRADDMIYQAAGLKPSPLSASPAMRRTLQEGMKKTKGLFTNLTRTTANTATKQFEAALDVAYMQVTSGAFDPATATKNAIKNLCKQGVNAVTYPSGRTDSMDVAVRRALITGVNQTALGMQETRAEELGVDLVETTAHAGARPSHALWQGQIFSRSGRNGKYPNLEQVTGYKTGAGLGGWNCSHSFRPYFEGMPRTYSKDLLDSYKAEEYSYNGKTMTEYEALQHQRGIERNIRRWKRENLAMVAAGQDTTESAVKLRRWRETEKDFLAQTGLKKQGSRSQVEGFGRSEAARVTSTAKTEQRNQARLKFLSRSGIIGKRDGYTAEAYSAMLKDATNVTLGGGITGLPPEGRPNTIVNLKKADGTVKQRRVYAADGRAMVDYDTYDHGRPKYHPTGAHRHTYDYSKKNPHGPGEPLTTKELELNRDIIQSGVNYHAPKTE